MKRSHLNNHGQIHDRQECDISTSSATNLPEPSPHSVAKTDASLTEEPQPSTSRSRSNVDNGEPERRLRKRRVDLNRLPSNIKCPQVCKFQHCGIQLRDGDLLEWHYQGHIAQEIEKLKKIRVKKSATHQALLDDVRSRRRVRKSAFEKIRFHREKRLALARSTVAPLTTPRSLECPVCGRSNISEDELQNHVEGCLRTTRAPPEEPDEFESEIDPEIEQTENLDVDSVDGFETYTWAGQTRIRATSLVEGGLRGAGFLTITRGDEDAELDIENVDDEVIAGAPQYTDEDVIFPTSEIDTSTTSNAASTIPPNEPNQGSKL